MKIDPQALAELDVKGATDFFVQLRAQADLSAAYEIKDWSERGWYVYNALQAAAQAQAPIIAFAQERGLSYNTYLANDSVFLYQATLDDLNQMAARSDVYQIRANHTYAIEENVLEQDEPRTIYWNLDELEPNSGLFGMQARQVWEQFGIRGEGVVVANIDTGVFYQHVGLDRQYRGNLTGNVGGPYEHDYNWYMPTSGCGDGTYPCDNNGHGSGTMGIMVGETEDLTEQVGAAPGAEWIACKGCEVNSCSDAALMGCADWMVAPTRTDGTDANPDMRPHVVNNSWGGDSCDSWYQDYIDAWRAAGIFPAFSAGNTTACDATGSPGDNPGAFGTAAHSSAGLNQYAGGPSCFYPDPSCDPDAHEVDPHLNSPTFGRTTGNTVGAYYNLSGTSGASPHTAGCVALMWSANPSLIGQIDETFRVLEQTADRTWTDSQNEGSCGKPTCAGSDPYPNYEYGWGYLDCFAAVNAVHDEIAVGVLSPDSDAMADFVAMIDGFTGITAQRIAGDLATMTLAQLQPYDVIVVSNNNQWSVGGGNPNIGNILADYVDAGGKIAMSQYAWDNEGWDLTGRLMSEGYTPFAMATGAGGAATLGTFDNTHPIMAGVSSLEVSGTYGHMIVPTTAGAQWVASWSTGQPLVYTQGDSVVGFNFLYEWENIGYPWIGDGTRLLDNSIKWLAQMAVTLPIAPTLDAIVNVDGNGDYTVSWNTVSGATSYMLQESTNGSFSGAMTVYSGSGVSAMIAGRAPGIYYYRVRASITGGDSVWSNTQSVTVVALPTAPALSAITNADGNGDYAVSWSTVSVATSYTLQEATNSTFAGAITAYSGVAASVAISGKTPGVYYYRVQSSNVRGNSPWSNVQSVMVVALPIAPVLNPIEIPNSNGIFVVSWNQVNAATSYTLQEANISSFNNPITVYTGNSLSTIMSGKASGTYYYRVRSANIRGDSEWSNVCHVTVPDPFQVYLPLILRDYLQYFDGPWEIESNDTYLQANGPLISGRDYRGYPDDERDYFSIYLREPGSLTINLTNHTGQAVQLQLFYQGIDNRVAFDTVPPYTITHAGQPGWYYIYIYTGGGYNSSTPYTLRVTYPE